MTSTSRSILVGQSPPANRTTDAAVGRLLAALAQSGSVTPPDGESLQGPAHMVTAVARHLRAQHRPVSSPHARVLRRMADKVAVDVPDC